MCENEATRNDPHKPLRVIASNTLLRLVGEGGIQSPGGKSATTKSRNSSMSILILDIFLQTFVSKSANLSLMACRFSYAKTSALLDDSSGWESAAGKLRELIRLIIGQEMVIQGVFSS